MCSEANCLSSAAVNKTCTSHGGLGRLGQWSLALVSSPGPIFALFLSCEAPAASLLRTPPFQRRPPGLHFFWVWAPTFLILTCYSFVLFLCIFNGYLHFLGKFLCFCFCWYFSFFFFPKTFQHFSVHFFIFSSWEAPQTSN